MEIDTAGCRAYDRNYIVGGDIVEWNVYRYDFNTHKIAQYNILSHYEDYIKKLKKKCPDIETFSELFRREMMYRFWSKCEHELIVEITDGRVILTPFIGSKSEEIRLDVTDDTAFDWVKFAKTKCGSKNKAKIDVYDQLRFRWDDYITYCWKFHHKWQRKDPKFCL